MKRRVFLRLAAASLAALGKGALAARPKHVIVVGAGIMGASIAYHLAKRGVSVTILEKSHPAGGATPNSFAWLNAFSKNPHSYYDLNMAGVMGWRRLQLDIGPELKIQWGGGIEWVETDEDVAKLKAQVAQRESFGYPTRLIDVEEIKVLLPEAVTDTFKIASFSDLEGTLDPIQATTVLLARAKRLGVRLVYPCEATALKCKSDRIESIATSQGEMAADHYVLAAGVATTALALQAGVAVPMVDAHGVLAHSKPMPPVVHRVVVFPGGSGLSVKQNPDGRIVMGTGAHFGGKARPTIEPTVQVGKAMLADAARYFPKLRQAQLDFMTIGYSPTPKDGLPVVGVDKNHKNLFVATMDSGVTLAPIIGQLACTEIIDDIPTDMLEPYRSTRFDGA